MTTDVCYWINHEVMMQGIDLCCLNTAVAESSLNLRSCGKLLEQDQFIQDHITVDDVLVVSIGGNDIVTPVLCTIVNFLCFAVCVPLTCMRNCACASPIRCGGGGWYGCGLTGCIKGFLCGWPPGLGYLVDLFKNRVENLIMRMLKRAKPKKVIVCMIYTIDEEAIHDALGRQCYAASPERLRTMLRTVFRKGTQQIRIPGTEVVAFPLFEVLDGKTPSDYEAGIEPSATGGRKIAAGLVDAILRQSVPDGQPDFDLRTYSL